MNFLRKLTIRQQLFIIAYLILIFFMLIFTVSYKINAEIVTKNNENYTNALFYQMEQTIYSNNAVLQSLTTNIAYNQLVQTYLIEEDHLEKFEMYENIHNFLLNLSVVQPGIIDFVIIGNNNNTFSLSPSTSWVRRLGDFYPDGAISYFSNMENCNFIDPRKACFAVGSNIYSTDMKHYRKKIGKIVILVETDAIIGGSELNFGEQNSSIFLLDRSNTIFLSNDNTMLGKGFHIPELDLDHTGTIIKANIDGEIQHIQIEDLPHIGGKMVRLIPDDVFFRDIRYLRRITMIISTIAFLFLAIPFFIILNNLVRPLQRLYNYMEIVKLDDLSKQISLEGSQEIEVIATRFNQMMDEFNFLTVKLLDSNERLYVAQLEMKEAEYAFLKSQINPHFLYNTLDSICGIASEHGVMEIREITRSLSKIFKYSIKGSEFVTLQEELLIVQAYMQIQFIRFSGRFGYECLVPNELMDCVVPKMILQPIVENAVYHGLEPRYKPGKLTLSAYLSDSRKLIIVIADDGVGMDLNTLKALNEGLMNSHPSEISSEPVSIGLLNVNNRLKFLYGQDYGITLQSEQNKGTNVTLKLSLQVKEREDEQRDF